ncbi:putative transporter [Insolitispirillum peregrinum]|uniref:putative transporter n=1 Tax=Insolitispirillum peregrinum TaxID=80876 RepID=UPI00360E4522
MLGQLLTGFNPIVQALLALCLAATLGLALGNLKIKGVGLGIGGVLFAGIFLGSLGMRGNHEVMDFLKEFGLILFVYTIGVQVGPGFFSSLRKAGIALNGWAALIVVLGVLTALGVHWLADIPVPVVLGLFSGAVTNTPSLAAGQQMLGQIGVTGEDLTLPGMGYAVAYPFGIAGILISMAVVKLVFRANPEAEAEAFEQARRSKTARIDTLNVRLTNPNLDGLRLSDMPGVEQLGVVVSRVLRQGTEGHVEIPHPDTLLHTGDVVLVVGTPEKLRAARLILGEEAADADLKAMDEDVRWERMVVTNSHVLGKSVGELDLLTRYDVVISRLVRSGIELVPGPHLHLQFGDILTVIGSPPNIKHVTGVLGNSEKLLQQAQIMPIFIGIALGVLLGSIPLAIPGMPAALKLGLAGGPLLAALILSRIGHLGPLVWFMPPSANHALREIGIVLFLAVVGLNSGEHFVEVLVHGEGLHWMMWAALITLIPLLVVGLCARLFGKQNYLTICGLLAGSMTDPPALAFANAVAPSEAPSLAYATVYPLVMCLRIIAPQVMVLILMGSL